MQLRTCVRAALQPQVERPPVPISLGLFLQYFFPRLVGVRYAGSISRLTIHACLPTCRPLVNPDCSNSSAVALNRNRP